MELTLSRNRNTPGRRRVYASSVWFVFEFFQVILNARLAIWPRGGMCSEWIKVSSISKTSVFRPLCSNFWVIGTGKSFELFEIFVVGFSKLSVACCGAFLLEGVFQVNFLNGLAANLLVVGGFKLARSSSTSQDGLNNISSFIPSLLSFNSLTLSIFLDSFPLISSAV